MRIKKWNDGWRFWKEKNAFSMSWSIPEESEKVVLPHDAMIFEAQNPDSAGGTATGFRDAGYYNYAKRFFVPAGMKGKRVILRLEGVYMNACVFINGEFAARERNGYVVFYADLTDHLRYGTENEVRVQVHAGANPNSRWYSGAGIYRDLYWMESGPCRILPDSVWTETESVKENGDAVILVKTGICNESETVQTLSLETFIKKDGETVQTAGKKIELRSGEKRIIRQRVTVQNARLWSADAPNLYCLESRLCYGDGKAADLHQSSFGIRRLELIPGQGLLVNGNQVKLRGACIHHDHGLLGAAGYENAEFRKIRLLKEAGFNAIRMAHHPSAPALLRACDELGMYVMDETFDMWVRGKSDYDYSLSFTDSFVETVEAMVKNDRSHPSVIMYSIGNEIPEAGTLTGTEIAEKICTVIRSLDNSRYTLQSINGAFACGDRMAEIMKDILDADQESEEGADVNNFMAAMNTHMGDIVTHPIVSECIERACASVDIAGYNYMDSRYEQDALAYPDRIIVGSETNPPVIAENWEKVKRIPNLIGDFTWTGWDYLGEAGIGVAGYAPGEGGFGVSFPVQLAYVGDLDITGYRRPISYYREIAFGLRTDPYIAVQDPDHFDDLVFKTPWVLSDAVSSWNWPGREGKQARVEVYAAGQKVRLLLNGKIAEEKAVGNGGALRTVFEIPYEAGVLTAVCLENDVETGRYSLCTATGKKTLAIREEKVCKDKDHILCWYSVTAVDKEGNVFADAADEITISSIKDLKFMGFGNADPKTKDTYHKRHTSLFQGRAQFIAEQTGPEPEVVIELKE